MKRNMKVLVKAANVQIEKLENFLVEHSGLYERRNLKLYDIAWNQDLQEKYRITDEQYSFAFYSFCETEYSFFEDWMEENNIEDTRAYIGRTSSFTLDNGIIETNKYDELDLQTTIANIIDNLYNNNWDDTYNSIDETKNRFSIECITNACKHTDKEWLDCTVSEIKDILEYIASGEMLEDFKSRMDDSIQIDEYLTGFMENQVDNFDEFLQMLKDDGIFEVEE